MYIHVHQYSYIYIYIYICIYIMTKIDMYRNRYTDGGGCTLSGTLMRTVRRKKARGASPECRFSSASTCTSVVCECV